MYYWLLNPSQQLPTPEQAKKYNRKGVDEDDIQIIKSSVEWYNITEGDCINWVHNLIVDRNYMGATAEQKVKEIIEKYLIEFRIKATVRLSSSVDDSEGKDLILNKIKKDWRSKLNEIHIININLYRNPMIIPMIRK